MGVRLHNPLRGRPTWDDRFSQYGIKVSFGGSGTLKIVIYVENYPQKTMFRIRFSSPRSRGSRARRLFGRPLLSAPWRRGGMTSLATCSATCSA